MKERNAQISLLMAKADNTRADAKIEYLQTIDALQQEQNEAGTTLQELKAAGDETMEVSKQTQKSPG